MITNKMPPIRGFLATPFIALAELCAYIAAALLPEPVLVINLNEGVILEEGDNLEDLFDEED